MLKRILPALRNTTVSFKVVFILPSELPKKMVAALTFAMTFILTNSLTISTLNINNPPNLLYWRLK